jgi:hypothetical protein
MLVYKSSTAATASAPKQNFVGEPTQSCNIKGIQAGLSAESRLPLFGNPA